MLSDALIVGDLESLLGASSPVGSKILVFDEIASTNDEAHRLGREGCPEGLVVFAESQTAGRGRHGRKWISPAGKGLWFTLLLRPRLPIQSVSRVTVMAAVAVAGALRRETGLPLKIKWPNDILCRGKKIAGILVEMHPENGGVGFVLVGIGIDVNLGMEDFPAELKSIASSLRLEADKSFHRPALAVAVLRELNACLPSIQDTAFRSLLDRWVEMDETIGRQVSILHADGTRWKGAASGIDADGALLVRKDDGRMERVIAGEVTLENQFV